MGDYENTFKIIYTSQNLVFFKFAKALATTKLCPLPVQSERTDHSFETPMGNNEHVECQHDDNDG